MYSKEDLVSPLYMLVISLKFLRFNNEGGGKSYHVVVQCSNLPACGITLWRGSLDREIGELGSRLPTTEMLLTTQLPTFERAEIRAKETCSQFTSAFQYLK
jgi:hypothetical protein